jgi:hypothetical protein
MLVGTIVTSMQIRSLNHSGSGELDVNDFLTTFANCLINARISPDTQCYVNLRDWGLGIRHLRGALETSAQ